MEAKTLFRASIAMLCATAALASNAGDLVYTWATVVNNGDLIPNTSKTFNSYNQPAVNTHGMVVFRARSRGGEGSGGSPAQGNQPEHGIFIRDMDELTPVSTVFTRGGTVPQPNNSLFNGQLAQFNEFPSVPRIDAGSDTIATRAQSQPVWTFTLSDGTDSRTGTAGVYTNAAGLPRTAASMVGDVPGFEYFQVPIPEAGFGIGFDQFPGSPAVTGRTIVVTKGNFTAGGGKTGVFYRNVVARSGMSPFEVIASSYTRIPGMGDITFGSTAPPSAAGKYVVFAGYVQESAPLLGGGIYRAKLGIRPVLLEKVVAIGDPVPDEAGQTFTGFGEAVSLSSNGRHVLFWGSWGGAMHAVTLYCSREGNKAVREHCLEFHDGTVVEVPDNQGFFVKDMQLGTIVAIAKTGGDGIKDFVYWKFSGRVPGMSEGGEGGDDIEEPARWRSATFGAVSATGVPSTSAVRAQTEGGDAIFVRKVAPAALGPTSEPGELVTLLETGMPGSIVDLEAQDTTISALGIERDGFRGQWLAVSVSMAGGAASEGWAGIYTARFVGLE